MENLQELLKIGRIYALQQMNRFFIESWKVTEQGSEVWRVIAKDLEF